MGIYCGRFFQSNNKFSTDLRLDSLVCSKHNSRNYILIIWSPVKKELFSSESFALLTLKLDMAEQILSSSDI